MSKLMLSTFVVLMSFSVFAEMEVINCNELALTACSAEYDPTKCTFGDITAEGTNTCDALIDLKMQICREYNDTNQSDVLMVNMAGLTCKSI